MSMTFTNHHPFLAPQLVVLLFNSILRYLILSIFNNFAKEITQGGSHNTMSSLVVTWTRDEDKAFENAIATHWTHEESKDDWDKIASMVPTKTMHDLKHHFRLLMDDVLSIEAGRIPLPTYTGDDAAALPPSTKDFHATTAPTSSSSGKKFNSGYGSGFSGSNHDSHGDKGSRSDQDRKKGIPWTEEEHRLFLLGLDKFGKGDWRSISRNFVISRTPTQVASHAQKYFIRLNSMNRDRRRSSIHDITSLNNGEVPSHQPTITGHPANPTQQPDMKHRAPHTHMAGIGMYGAHVGHPIAAPPGHGHSAVGTPVMIPPGHHHRHHPHPPFAVPFAYPMAPPTMHH